VCGPQEGHFEKDAKSKVAAKNGCDGRLIAKILMMTIQLNLCCLSKFHYDLAPNSPELSLLKFLLLAYHHSHSWPPPWISHLFFKVAFLGAAHFFYSWAVFGLDFISFCNFMLYCHQWLLLLVFFLSIEADMGSSTCVPCIIII